MIPKMIGPREFWKLMCNPRTIMYSSRKCVLNGVEYETMIAPADVPKLLDDAARDVLAALDGKEIYKL